MERRHPGAGDPRTGAGLDRDPAPPPTPTRPGAHLDRIGAGDMSTTARHVIFGTGAIGLATFDALRRRGESVRLVNRSGHAHVPDDVKVVGGDASDSAFTTAVAPAPASSTRPSTRPTASGQRSSRPCRPASWSPRRRPGRVWSAWKTSTCTDDPMAIRSPRTAPTTRTPRKGNSAGRWPATCSPPTDAGRVQVAIGRASDYFGPRGGAQSNLGDRVIARRPGRKNRHGARRPGPAAHLHLPPRHRRRPRRPRRTPRRTRPGLAPAQRPGHPHHPPTHRHRLPCRRTTPRPGARNAPTFLLRTLGLVNPVMRELVEMQYEYQAPFIVDSSKITDKLGAHATPLDTAVQRTLDSYRS